MLKELCLEHKDGDYIHTALKSKDKFGQTPMLSSISASENRNEILKFLLNLILERSSDTALQEVEKLLQQGHIHVSSVSGGDSSPKQTPRFHPNSLDEEPRSVSRDSAAFLQDFHVRRKTTHNLLIRLLPESTIPRGRRRVKAFTESSFKYFSKTPAR